MKKCFLIAPIGTPKSEVRNRTDILWEFIIAPVCTELDYEPIRADLMTGVGSITQDIIRMLLNADLVVADITNLNPNVMYELGVRHSSGKPAIVLAQEKEIIPFDIASYRVIYYNLDNPKDARRIQNDLTDTIRRIEKGGATSSPVNDVIGSMRRTKLPISDKSTDSHGPLLRSISERIKVVESSIAQISRSMPTKNDEVEFTRDVFIVHGHDGDLKNELARFLQRLDFNPIILHEQPDRGQTILQKLQFEGAKVGYAFILHTPDDEGRKKDPALQLTPRSRQNVVFEHGMFVGQFSHLRVCAIVKEGVEIPSDLSGVIYKRIPTDGGLDSIVFQLVRELRAAGYIIDANKLLV